MPPTPSMQKRACLQATVLQVGPVTCLYVKSTACITYQLAADVQPAGEDCYGSMQCPCAIITHACGMRYCAVWNYMQVLVCTRDNWKLLCICHGSHGIQ